MVKKEFYKTRKDGAKLYKTYSDKNLKIKQIETNIIFDEAIDILKKKLEKNRRRKKIICVVAYHV